MLVPLLQIAHFPFEVLGPAGVIALSRTSLVSLYGGKAS